MFSYSGIDSITCRTFPWRIFNKYLYYNTECVIRSVWLAACLKYNVWIKANEMLSILYSGKASVIEQCRWLRSAVLLALVQCLPIRGAVVRNSLPVGASRTNDVLYRSALRCCCHTAAGLIDHLNESNDLNNSTNEKKPYIFFF